MCSCVLVKILVYDLDIYLMSGRNILWTSLKNPFVIDDDIIIITVFVIDDDNYIIFIIVFLCILY